MGVEVTAGSASRQPVTNDDVMRQVGDHARTAHQLQVTPDLRSKVEGLIHDEAKNADVPLLLGGLAEQRFLEARARGLNDQDMASLVRLWEEPAGVTVDKPAPSA